MEKIGNIGWFFTNEEMAKLQEVFDVLRLILPRRDKYDKVDLPYDREQIEINKPQYPNWPWKNPADWTWRPWQEPWYGNPGDPVSPQEWKVGDGEWWKHQPYCTSTTEDNPNAVKESKTDDNQCL